MRTFNKTPLALGVAAGMAMLVASTGALAISTGTDLNLSAKARAGGMAGAAYTMPQEASAAVFGNPATLTQFKGINMNFGASLLSLAGVENEQQSTVIGGAFAGSYSNTSTSDADNYIIPDFGLTLQISPNLVIGTGLEVDAGLGADYRDDPITLLGGLGGDADGGTLGGGFTLPLLVEVISFNANLAAAYQMSEKLSVGAAVTIGFGLAQLGTAGPTGNLNTLNGAVIAAGIPVGTQLTDFGGTTSSVHDIGFGGSLGATYLVQEGIMLSATIKSPLEYNFKNIIHADQTAVPDVIGTNGFQDLTIQQPTEIILGVAFDDVLAPGLLVEVDAVWKNWSDAHAYEDAYEDQWLILLGAQYEAGDFTYRVGYSYAQDILSGNNNGTLGGLDGVGTIDLEKTGGGLPGDVIKIVQNTLLPTIWNHTITAGIGYAITDAVSVDAYAAYAFGEDDKASLPTLAAVAGAALGGAATVTSEAKIDYELMIGAGINIALP